MTKNENCKALKELIKIKVIKNCDYNNEPTSGLQILKDNYLIEAELKIKEANLLLDARREIEAIIYNRKKVI